MSHHTFFALWHLWNTANCYFWGAVFVVWLIFTVVQSVINRIGFSAIRTRNGALETAIITYEHPKTQRQVVCIGMSHVAQKSYYENLQSRIDAWGDQGYAILYEGVGLVGEEELHQLTERQQKTVAYAHDLKDAMRQMSEVLGFVYQSDSITYRPLWTRTDMDRLQFIRCLTACGLSDSLVALPNVNGVSHHEYRQWLQMQAHKSFASFPTFCLAINLIPWRGRVKQILDLILRQRNEIAVQAIRERVGDTVTMWGAAHLVGIGRHLRRDGFREVGRQWVVACPLRRYGRWESLRLTARMYWSALDNLTPVEKGFS